MNKIAKNYLYNTIYQILTLVIPVLMTPYISRVLGASQLGIYDYLNSIITLVATVCLLGIGHYGSREVAYVRDDTLLLSRTFWNILLTQLFLGVICIIFVMTLTNFTEYRVYTFSFLFWIIGYIVDCTWLYIGLEDMEHAVVKNIIAKLFFIAGTFLFVKTEYDLILYIVFNGVAVLLANILAYSKLNKYVLKPKFDFSTIGKHIAGSLNLFLPLFATQLTLSLNKIILGSLVTDIAAVAYYSNAEKIVQIPLSLIVVMNTVMMPRLAHEFRTNNKKNIEKYLSLSSSFSIFLACPLMVGIFVTSETLVPWFLGSEFISSIVVIKMLTPIILLNTLLGISGSQYLVATNKMNVLLISNIFSAIVNISLDLILVPYIGVYGICLSTIFSLIAALSIQYNEIRKEIRLSFVFYQLIKYLSMSLLMGIIIKVLFYNTESGIMATFLQVLTGLSSYIFIGFVLRDEILCKAYSGVKEIVRRK